MTSSNTRGQVLIVCLGGLAAALIGVGLVSGTVLRHIVQIVPMIAALLLVMRRPATGAYAALPIFLFWTMIVILIWLFLLGLSRLISGHFAVAEIVLTFVMAICCVIGAVRAIPIGRPSGILVRVATFVGFAALQVIAMWISFQPSIANR